MGKTSIIILTYNQLNYTKMCINSIRLYTKPDYEIIVVDNASTDGTAEWLREQNDIATIFNDFNKGFAGGCNQGILKADGDVIVLLNNDTIVTPRWLENLLICLNSSDKIGVAGVCSNKISAYQAIPVSYTSFGEIISFADKFNVSNAAQWKERIRLVGLCFAVKKTVVNKVGLLDERFFPGNFEDDDYSFRILQAGYKLIFCGDTFIHHYGNVSFENTASHANAMALNRKKFEEKWGINPTYHTNIRFDIINLMNKSDSLRNIRVLEVGCGCGGTLLEIKNLFPHAEIFGIEINRHATQIAANFADIQIGDVEKMDFPYPADFFDYILFPDVLEHLVNPWEILTKMKKYLKPTGEIIASIPNVMHFSIISSLLIGMWRYTESGILEKNHLRFFTLATIREMFEKSGYLTEQINEKISPEVVDDNTQKFLKYLHMAIPLEKRNELLVYQYIVKAKHND